MDKILIAITMPVLKSEGVIFKIFGHPLSEHLKLVQQLRIVEGISINVPLTDDHWIRSVYGKDAFSVKVKETDDFEEKLTKVLDVLYAYFGNENCTVSMDSEHPVDSAEDIVIDDIPENFEPLPPEILNESYESWKRFLKKHKKKIEEEEEKKRSKLN